MAARPLWRWHIRCRRSFFLEKEPVSWHSATKSVLNRTKPENVTANKNNYVQLWIDGKRADAVYQPILHNGLTFMPIRTVTAAFGLEVK
nr:stalk domain-containing protein [Paenibacillus daejeonensis]